MVAHGSAETPVPREGERRRHGRLHAPFPVLVRGLAVTGEGFEIQTVLDNCSAGGFYVRLPLQVAVGTTVVALIRFAARHASGTSRLRVAVRGRVVRTAFHLDGRWGVGVEIRRYRFV